jgi:hypothetical protein
VCAYQGFCARGASASGGESLPLRFPCVHRDSTPEPHPPPAANPSLPATFGKTFTVISPQEF